MPELVFEVPQLRLLVVGLHAPMNVAGSQPPFGMTEAFFGRKRRLASQETERPRMPPLTMALPNPP